MEICEVKIFWRYYMELNPITQTQALKIIETEIGFPNPTAKFVEWYFKEDGGTFIPIVNFE